MYIYYWYGFLNLNDSVFVHVEIPILLKQMVVDVGAYRALGINALCLCTRDKAVVSPTIFTFLSEKTVRHYWDHLFTAFSTIVTFCKMVNERCIDNICPFRKKFWYTYFDKGKGRTPQRAALQVFKIAHFVEFYRNVCKIYSIFF